MSTSKHTREGLGLEPFWYKSGVIYEVHVRAFYDANGDGAGDFAGLTQKLDYIKDLCVTAIWLLPFYPSPLKDDGYDIADYCDVHPMYGTLGDFKVVDFWLDLGVDGLRLDAVPYLYERDGTSCESLPETHAYLKSLRAHVDEKYGDRMLLAEANLWPEDAVSYFGQGRGDECHMAFHFPLMPRLFMALRMEDRLPIVEILEQTPAIPETSQ